MNYIRFFSATLFYVIVLFSSPDFIFCMNANEIVVKSKMSLDGKKQQLPDQSEQKVVIGHEQTPVAIYSDELANLFSCCAFGFLTRQHRQPTNIFEDFEDMGS